MKIALTIHTYPHLVEQHGMRDHPACHALMEYALTAGRLIEDRNKTVTGQPKKIYNWRNIMNSIGMVHGIDPGEMVRHWDEVDRVLRELRLPPITSLSAGGDNVRQDNRVILTGPLIVNQSKEKD